MKKKMASKYGNLTIIIPTTRGKKVVPIVESAFMQSGFEDITVIISGKSTGDEFFVNTLRNDFNNKNLHIAYCKNKEIILPGEARNDGLRYMKNEGINAEYVLFLDDDIRLPQEYSMTVVNYMKKVGSCAVTGRVSSSPVNFWTKIIDYSNFWWLQMEESVADRGWLGAGSTLVKFDDIKDIYFNEDAAINEDVIFFTEIAKRTKGVLSVCSETTSEHNHERKNFKEFFIYQFNNGKKGVLFHANGVSLVRALKNIRHNFYTAFKANRKFLRNNKVVAVGVFLSFIVFEIGVQYGSLLKIIRELKKRSFKESMGFFLKSCFSSIVNGKLRQPLRRIYYAVRLKKIK